MTDAGKRSRTRGRAKALITVTPIPTSPMAVIFARLGAASFRRHQARTTKPANATILIHSAARMSGHSSGTCVENAQCHSAEQPVHGTIEKHPRQHIQQDRRLVPGAALLAR